MGHRSPTAAGAMARSHRLLLGWFVPAARPHGRREPDTRHEAWFAIAPRDNGRRLPRTQK